MNEDQNEDRPEAQAQQAAKPDLAGKVKQTWSRLQDEDIALVNGQRDKFFEKLKAVYGISKEEAQKRLSELEKPAQGSTTSRAA